MGLLLQVVSIYSKYGFDVVILVLLFLVYQNLLWSIENKMAIDGKSIGFES
jgi:hypothetical protein